MFNIKYIDIGGDGCVTEQRSHVDTLEEAEVVATVQVGEHLANHRAELIHDEDLLYEVYADGRSVGVVSIRVM